jgi:phage terminase large subunit GpA-like protein
MMPTILMPHSVVDQNKTVFRKVAITLPSWMPAELRARVKARLENPAGRWRFSFSRAERAVLRRRAPMPVSQWAEKYRVVQQSSIPGRWHNSVTPYMTGIMDASFHEAVRTVIICKCPQSGGTEGIHNCIGYAIDRSPGPVMYVYPDEVTARENAKDRILPMIEASPRLSSYLTGSADDRSSLRINLQHMHIFLGWSGSAARLGNKPIRYLVLDELDKYQGSKKEATAEALAEKRTITWRHKARIWKVSTPTVDSGPITLAMTTEAQVRFDYHVRCPHCGMEQVMVFENIRWPENERDPAEVSSKKLAEYLCEHCGVMWDDGDRDRAVRLGLWRARESGLELQAHLDTYRPEKIGFHIPAWLSYFVSLSKVAESFLRWDNSKNQEQLKDFCNNYKAEPWRHYRVERQEDRILALCDDRPRGIVPGPLQKDGISSGLRVAALVAGIDTQGSNEAKGYFRYVIRAFGWGENEESWLIQCGTVPSFSALAELLWGSVYRDGEGNEYRVRLALQDAMGHRTSEVYSFCAANKGRIFPTKGTRIQSAPVKYPSLEYYPGTQRRIPGGLKLVTVDTTFFKNDLAAKLEIPPEDAGAFHLHNDTPLEYAKEMVAEYYDEKVQAWVCPEGRANHYWDCEVLALAAAYILGIRNWKRKSGDKSVLKAKKAAPHPSLITNRPNWLGGMR